MVDRVATGVGTPAGPTHVPAKASFLKKQAEKKTATTTSTKLPIKQPDKKPRGTTEATITTPDGTYPAHYYNKLQYAEDPSDILRRENAAKKRAADQISPPNCQPPQNRKKTPASLPTEDEFHLVTSKRGAKPPTPTKVPDIPLQNSFETLATLPTEKENSEAPTTRKPPPIITKGDRMPYAQRRLQIKTICQQPFTADIVNRNTVKYYTANLADFKAVTAALKDAGVEYYTRGMEPQDFMQVVIRKLPMDTPCTEILDELASKGFPVKTVTQLTKSYSYFVEVTEEDGSTSQQEVHERKPIPIFAVRLALGEKSKTILQTTHLLNAAIKVEYFRNPRGPPQCKRCQRLGHTQRNCERLPRCVKCPGKHATKECNLKSQKDFRCVNCNGPHTANYRGCKVIVEARKQKKDTNNGSDNQIRKTLDFVLKPPEFPGLNNTRLDEGKELENTSTARTPIGRNYATATQSNSFPRPSQRDPRLTNRIPTNVLPATREEATNMMEGLTPQEKYQLLMEHINKNGILEEINNILLDIIYPPAGQTRAAAVLKLLTQQDNGY